MAAMERSLSELPEDVILHIFSNLHHDNQEAVRLGLLSKQMLSIVRNRPNLVFDCYSYRNGLQGTKYIDRYSEELEYTQSTLARYCREAIPLQTFTLQGDGRLGYVKGPKLCLDLAAKMGLRNLKLWMLCPGSQNMPYSLPQPVFEIKSLVELELKNCVLRPERTVTWPNLKRLSLTSGCDADEKVFENIISGSPCIENLEVHVSYSLTISKGKVANLPNLKHLKINLGRNQYFEVREVPNLESITSCSWGFLDLGGAEYPNLKTLHVEGFVGEKNFTNFARKFPMLENLFLEGNQTLRRIEISSTSLKEIRLENMDALEEASFDVPNLVHFKYKNWPPGDETVPKLSFIGNSCGWSSCIELNSVCWNSRGWFLKLNDLLVPLNGPETCVTVRLYRSLHLSAAHQTLYDSVTIPRIKEFSMSTYEWSEINLSSASAIVDGIFWICQPQTITFVDCNKYEFPRLLYEKLMSTSCQDHPYVADFEMVHGTARVKDWGELVELEAKLKLKKISFHLEYVEA